MLLFSDLVCMQHEPYRFPDNMNLFKTGDCNIVGPDFFRFIKFTWIITKKIALEQQ